jgi:hypothetical protein
MPTIVAHRSTGERYGEGNIHWRSSKEYVVDEVDGRPLGPALGAALSRP